MTELGNKDRDLRYQARKIAATDKAAADKLYAEAAVYGKQLADIRTAHFKTLQPQFDALKKEEDDLFKSIPASLRLQILVNGSGIDMRNLTPSAPQAGAGVTASNSEKTVLAYGPWNKTTGAMNASFPKGGKIQKVYGIVVTADGDQKQAEMLLSKLDGATLKDLIGK